MEKPLLRATSIILLLAGLLSATPALTQEPDHVAADFYEAAAFAQTAYIPAAEDTTINSFSANRNFGTDDWLQVHYDPFWPSLSYFLIRFDVASALPPGAIIDSASMELYLTDIRPGSILPFYGGAYAVTSSWSELSVTWNTRPTSELIGVGTQIYNSLDWYRWMATSYARAWQANPAGNHGVEVRGPATGQEFDVYFASREAELNRPLLVVSYHLPTTPSPTTTASPTPSPTPTSRPGTRLYLPLVLR